MLHTLQSPIAHLTRTSLLLCLLANLPHVATDASAQATSQVNAPGATSAGQLERARPDAVRREREARRLVRRLNLSPEQVVQLREIRRQSTSERQIIVANLRRAQRELEAEIFSEETSEIDVEARARLVSELQAKATLLRATTELKIRRLLTPQQLGALREMRERGRARREARAAQRR